VCCRLVGATSSEALLAEYVVSGVLEDRRGNYQNCSVLCCVRQWYSTLRTHIRAALKVECWFWGDRLLNGSPYATGPLSCLSVCNVGVLLPNGLMDQDETWHGGKPRPWPHCVIWDPASPPQRGTAPIFGPCMLWPQAEWIKMPLGTKVGLGPSHIVLDGDPAPPPR